MLSNQNGRYRRFFITIELESSNFLKLGFGGSGGGGGKYIPGAGWSVITPMGMTWANASVK